MSAHHEEAPRDIREWATLGTRARWAREQAGLSVRQAAEVSGLSVGEVDAIEMDVADRLVEIRLWRLAPVYEVSLDWLRDGTVTEAARAATMDTIGMMTRAGTPVAEQWPVVLLLLCQDPARTMR